VARGTVARWVSLHRKSGKRALAPRRRGRPPEPRLKGHQAATIKRLVVDRCPDQMRLPFALWTREAVAALIKRKFGLSLSVWTVGRYLRRWGFSPQKPAKRAFERDPEQVERWLKEEYPGIRAAAKREKAEILWGDEIGVRSDHQAGTTWGKRGATPVVAAPGKRFGCNMISAISNRGSLKFRVFRGRFSAPVFVDFLRRLIRSTKRKVFLIADRHPAHRARRVTRWLADHEAKIKLFFLPPYSPDLNPDEFLNNDVKTNGVARSRPRNDQSLMKGVRSYLWGRQRRRALVRRYFQAPSVQYAA